MTLKKKKKDAKLKKVKFWSPHRYLVAGIRQTWYWSPERREALKKAKLDKDKWQCATCPNIVVKEQYITKKGRKRTRMTGSVDHIVPIGKQPRSWAEYGPYLEKTFCPSSNLQVLCKQCHDPKSKLERQTR